MIAAETFSSAQIVVVGHAGHWLANLLYLLPVVVLAAGIAWQRWNDRNSTRERDGEESDPVSRPTDSE